MASSTAPTIDASGVITPSFADILAFLKAQYRTIYGADVYLENDSQDGQFLGIIAAAINDSNSALVAAYNSFSPATAQGNGLSNNVKINGITRLVSSNSTVDVQVVGVAGTTISNGVVADLNGNKWNLPAAVTIPFSGTITVTATAQVAGSISATSNTVNKIQTPIYGWQTVNNVTDASVGSPVENDAQLRIRQTSSVALPSTTVLSGIVGAVENIFGVTQVAAYENDTNSTDANTLPPHSMSVVVEGGDSTAIASAILNKKTIGAYTYGSTSVSLIDSAGVTNTIRFYRPTISNIKVGISLHALYGYTTAISNEVKAAVAAYINSLPIGKPVMIARLYVPAQLNGAADYLTFEVVAVTAALVGGTLGSSDITVGFNGLAQCDVANITISVI